MIFALSVIPDIDILIPFIEHRGPTHSVIALSIAFVPLFLVYGKKTAPYLFAIIQHPLIGDYFMGGHVQLFWPLTTKGYGVQIGIKSSINITAELVAFIISMLIMIENKDINYLLRNYRPKTDTIALIVPLFALVAPLAVKFPIDVPAPLIPAHMLFISMFLISIIKNQKR